MCQFPASQAQGYLFFKVEKTFDMILKLQPFSLFFQLFVLHNPFGKGSRREEKPMTVKKRRVVNYTNNGLKI